MPVLETGIAVAKWLLPTALRALRPSPSRISVVRKVARKYGVGSKEWAAIARKFPKAAARYERRGLPRTAAGPIVLFPPGGRRRGGARRAPPRAAPQAAGGVPPIGPPRRLPGRLLGRTPAAAAALIVADYAVEYGKKLYQQYRGLEGPPEELLPTQASIARRGYTGTLSGPYFGGGRALYQGPVTVQPYQILPPGSPPLQLPRPPRVEFPPEPTVLQRVSSYGLANPAILAAATGLLLPKKTPAQRVNIRGLEQPTEVAPEAPVQPALASGGLTPLESALIQSLQGEAKQPAAEPQKSLAQRCKERAARQRKKKGKRKLRSVCYQGSYRETRTGLRKTKRRRVPCK